VATNEKELGTVLIAPSIKPRDLTDVCLGASIGLAQILVLFAVLGLLVWSLAHSLFAAVFAATAAAAFLGFFTVRGLVLSPQGMRFLRLLGKPSFLAWDQIRSVAPAPRSEVILRGLLWPPLFPREMTASLTLHGHYRIEYRGGFCYYPPADPKLFEAYLDSKLPKRT
jgi:hypothetical protein